MKIIITESQLRTITFQNLYAEVTVVGMDAYNMTDGTQVNIIELDVSGDGSIQMSVYNEEQGDPGR